MTIHGNSKCKFISTWNWLNLHLLAKLNKTWSISWCWTFNSKTQLTFEIASHCVQVTTHSQHCWMISSTRNLLTSENVNASRFDVRESLLYLVDDDKFLASLCGGIAVIILLIPMLRTVIQDLSEKKMKMHELVVLACRATKVWEQLEGRWPGAQRGSRPPNYEDLHRCICFHWPHTFVPHNSLIHLCEDSREF